MKLLFRQILRFIGKTAHDRERFWLHFPVGAGALYLTLRSPAVGLIFAGIFLTYEIAQIWENISRNILDESHKDIFGFAFGYGIAAYIILLIKGY